MSMFTLSPRFKNAPHFKSYWENGNGKHIVKWSEAQVSFEKFDNRSKLCFQVVELGDQVIKDFYSDKLFHKSNLKLENFIRNGIPANEEVPESVKALFEFTEHVPDRIDKDLLLLGAEASMKRGEML